MKIAMLYASWEAYGEPWSTPLGLKWEIESRGHEVIHFNLYHANGALHPHKKVRHYSDDGLNQFNYMYRNGYRPDAVLVCDYGPYDSYALNKKFFPDVPFILEAGDTPQSARMHAQKAHKFHALVTPDWESAERFNAAGIHTLWMNHWADDRIFHDQHGVDPVFDVVSTCGGRRVTAEVQAALGDRFNNERYFFGEDHARRLCMGHIVFQCSQFGEITRRIFEGMACNRMVLTDRLPENTNIGDLFKEGEDIVFYDSAADAVDKVNYYMSHPEERDEIAANGWRKVMEAHTVGCRVDKLEELIRTVQHDILRSTPTG